MEGNTATIVLIAAVVLIFGAIITFVFINWLREFRGELDNLNREIERSRGGERAYWKSRKRRLLWSILPFVKY